MMNGLIMDVSPTALANWALSGVGGLGFWALQKRLDRALGANRWLRAHLAAHVHS